MTTTAPKRPVPRPSDITKPFWEAAHRGEIRVQKCRACGQAEHPPRPICKHCWSDDLEWIRCSGAGEVYSYTICHWATVAAFKTEVPYVVAIVDLPEGVRMNARIVDCAPDAVSVGMKVTATFQAISDDISLVNFKPV